LLVWVVDDIYEDDVMVAMVNVGGKLVPENQTYTYSSGYGTTVKLKAAQAADVLRSQNLVGSNGQWQDEGDQAGAWLGMDKPVAAPKPAPKPAPSVAKPAPKKTALTKPAVSAPPQVKKPSDPVTKKERAEISKPAKGLENTIKTSPTLLRERRRRTYLTRG
jgi:hypothetical protein